MTHLLAGRYNSGGVAQAPPDIPISANGQHLELRPFQIVSLLDMLRVNAGVFQAAFLVLGHFEREFRELCDQGQGDIPLDQAMLEKFQSVTKVALDEAEKVQFQKALDRRTNCEMYAALKLLTYNSAYHEIKELREAIHGELYRREFLVLSSGEGKYFNKKHPFGELVYNNFEDARHDIREAGNCYALDRTDACVFHLTRVLEIGLKAMVTHLGASIPDIDSQTWEPIINKIESEIDKIRAGKKSTMKAKELEFYAGAAKQFRYFKEHWRNPVDHYRATYDKPQALSAFQHVEDFMRDIAKRGVKSG